MASQPYDVNIGSARADGAASRGRPILASIAHFPEPQPAAVDSYAAIASSHSSHLIGESPAMVEVAAQLRRVASSQATVMLVGESGTGKEVAVEYLHAHSARSSAPLISVNCGAIPADLVEAELFGYERGAFTGAARRHRGYFERAAGGTLFLDEITEMPLDLQPKLLRALETGRMFRVGGTAEIAVDVRIVTATNRSPDAIVRDRRLREDLYYRLAVVVVELPPLRERQDDVELLARAFLERLNAAYGTRKRFVAGALALARAHCWPGNVRELKNCIERSYLLCDDAVALDVQPMRELPGNSHGARDFIQVPVGSTLADAERAILLGTLRHCGGNKRRTAEMLGISVKTIYNKLVGGTAPASATPLSPSDAQQSKRALAP